MTRCLSSTWGDIQAMVPSIASLISLQATMEVREVFPLPTAIQRLKNGRMRGRWSPLPREKSLHTTVPLPTTATSPGCRKGPRGIPEESHPTHACFRHQASCPEEKRKTLLLHVRVSLQQAHGVLALAPLPVRLPYKQVFRACMSSFKE